MVIASGPQWHAKKETSIHERLEDGTLPFHSIIALDAAFDTHKRIYGSMANISAHTGFLVKQVYDSLSLLRHYNRTKACRIYQSDYGNPALQGPIVAFNLKNSGGEWIPKTDIERRAATRDIQLRSGSVCNPGGTASSLGWAAADLCRHYAAGLRCGNNHDVLDGRPTGVLRISLGAMTNLKDIKSLIQFISEVYVEKVPPVALPTSSLRSSMFVAPRFYVESLAIFPIRGCGAFEIPAGEPWEVSNEGLAWDHAWCLVHEKTGKALDEETYPQMALIRPTVHRARGILRISCDPMAGEDQFSLEIPFTWAETSLVTTSKVDASSSCKEGTPLHFHSSNLTKTFFSELLGVPCTLVRYSSQSISQRQLPRPSNTCVGRMRKLFRHKAAAPGISASTDENGQRSHFSSNDPARPIVSKQSAIQHMNQATAIHAMRGIAISKTMIAEMFRANIVVAERVVPMVDAQKPNAEQHWSTLHIGQDRVYLNALKNDRRNQSGRNDQTTGTDGTKSFVRVMIRQTNGKNLLGAYAILPTEDVESCDSEKLNRNTIAVRDVVLPSS
jgi:molybdenum cofactor sulfurtransferase